MEGTLRAALGLLPPTRCVALGGTAPPDRYFNDLAGQAIRAAPMGAAGRGVVAMILGWSEGAMWLSGGNLDGELAGPS